MWYFVRYMESLSYRDGNLQAVNETVIEIPAALTRNILTEQADAMRDIVLEFYGQGRARVIWTRVNDGDGLQCLEDRVSFEDAIKDGTRGNAALAAKKDGPAGMLQSLGKVRDETLILGRNRDREGSVFKVLLMRADSAPHGIFRSSRLVFSSLQDLGSCGLEVDEELAGTVGANAEGKGTP